MTVSRATLWWIAAVILAASAVAGAFYLDAPTQAWMAQHQARSLKLLMRNVSHFGDWPEHIALGVLLLAGAYWRGSKKWMRVFAAMLVACAVAGLVARAVKIGTARARPSVQAEGGWSGPKLASKYNAFPSGHTAASAAFFATLAFASWRIGAPLLLIPLLIAFSRMYVAAHFLSDVVCAFVLGVVCAWIVWRWLLPADGSKRPTSNVQRPTPN